MKIGFFTDSYRPYTSGVVRSIETFTDELTNQGHQVYIFAPQYKDCEKEPRIFRYTSLPSPTNQDFSLAIPISVNARPLVKKLGLDIIHVHSPFLMGRHGARIAKMERIPLIYTYHTLYDKYVHYIPFAQNLSSKLVQKFTVDFCNRCDLVVVPTKIVKTIIRQNGVTSPIVDIPTGIDLKGYEQGDKSWLRQTYNIPVKDKILLFVGRIGQEKNLDFLVKCFAQIQQKLVDTTLVLVGGGPQEEALKILVKSLGIEKKVIFTGTLNRTSVIDSYVGSDLFVFASITETQGLVIGEAQAAGLPVVAVDAFGVKEMVKHGDSGFLTQLDMPEFTQHIMKLLTDPYLYQQMSKLAKIQGKHISSQACATKLVETYQEVIQTKNKVVVGY